MKISPAMESNLLTEREREWLQAIAEGRDIHVIENGWTVVSKKIDRYPHIFMIKWQEPESGNSFTSREGELQPACVYCFKLQAK